MDTIVLVIIVAFSWYWPAWGGVNGSPTGNVANGDPWQQWAYQGAACPAEWELGTRIVLDGQVYTCVDRGALIGYTKDGRPLVDFLTDKPAYAFKESVTVWVLPPAPDTSQIEAALAAVTKFIGGQNVDTPMAR